MDEYTILKKKKQKNGFATTAILAAIAFVLLALVLFLFLMGKADKSKSIVNANGGNTGTEKISNESKDSTEITEESETCVSESKERIFNDNLRTIKDAAVSYFTTERLPVKIGDTKKLTLKEMQDKKLVLSMVDSKGKVCGADTSYVEVTKEKTEYTMKINLSCSDMEDYIIIHLGCYDYCKGNVCEKQIDDITEFEYEYKKSTGCKMTGWSKWSDWKTTREKTSSNKKEDSKVVATQTKIVDVVDAEIGKTTYSCDAYGKDYKLDGKVCVKTTTKIETIDAQKSDYSYVCPEDYKLNGSKCEKEIVKKDTKDAKENPVSYNCDKYPGYDLVGNKCVKTSQVTETKDALPNPVTYTCASYGSNYELNGTTCTSKDTKNATKVEGTYTCESYGSEYKLNGTKCEKEIKKEVNVGYKAITQPKEVKNSYVCGQEKECSTQLVFDEKTGAMVPQESCKFKNKMCYKTSYVDEVVGYYCPAEEVNGKCVKYELTTDTKNAIKTADTYNCDKYPGYKLSGTSCVKTDTKPAKENPTTYTCASYGSEYKLNGTTCTKTYEDKKEENATKNPTTYTCASYGSEYKLNGTSCVKTYSEIEATNAVRVQGGYTCKDGYGYNSKTKVCEKTIITINEKDAKEIKGALTCPVGYELNGNECTKTTTEEIKTTYYRYATRTCVGGTTDTKWSIKNDTDLLNNGYKLTGNKRAITVTEK